MLTLIVCDWNRTLHSSLYEEGYFGGLCWRAFWRAVRQGRGSRILGMVWAGVQCMLLFALAWWRRERSLEYVTRITRVINQAALAGLPAGLVTDFTRRYGRRTASRIDRRLLEPLRRIRESRGVRLAVISSGSRRGIEEALAHAGCPFDVVRANEFHMDDGHVVSLELSIMANKHEILAELLAEEGVTAAEAMYIGDSHPDLPCLQAVAYPVVSFLAREADKHRFAVQCGAFVPQEEADFLTHLQAVCGDGRGAI